MKPENRVEFYSREEPIATGDGACKIGNPDDMRAETLFISHYGSPLGTYTIVTSSKGIVFLASPVTASNRLRRLNHMSVKYLEGGEHNAALAHELGLYFTGKLIRFTVPLDRRGTPFQLKVWGELCRIPYGKTRSYRQIARTIGYPLAARAVGHAVGNNPIAIVLPCHRVIGADGSLTGYASGLDRKRYLLNLEARTTGKKLTW